MDFPFSADESSGSSSSDRGYFRAQALRAGMFAYPGDFPPGAMLPPFYGMNMIEREILKESIREEIIAREVMERRILEEEVRRELEFERAMFARRYTENVLSERVSETGMQKAEVEFGRRTPTIFDLPAKRKYPESLPIAQVDPSKLTGIKRKSACGGVFPQPTTWGCALCKVSCTTKEALDEHLRGKKHKSKASQLAGSKVAIVIDKPSPSTTKDDDIPKSKSIDLTNSKTTTQPNSKSSGQPNSYNTGQHNSETTRQPISKTTRQSKRKFASESTAFKNKIFRKPSIWRCELCKLECNSATMLNGHLKGKKHNTMLKALGNKIEVKIEAIVNASGDMIDKRPDEVKENVKEAILEENNEKLKTLTTVNANNTGMVIDKKLIEVKQDEKKETSNIKEMKRDNDQKKEANNKEEIKKVYVVEKDDDNEEVPKEEAEAETVQDGNPEVKSYNKEETLKGDDEEVPKEEAKEVQEDRMMEEDKEVETQT